MRFYNQIWAILFCLSLAASAQPPENLPSTNNTALLTNRPVRSLSMEEAIRLAVEHNFAIAIARYVPQINQFLLSGTYGYYDPVFQVTSSHSDSQTEPTPIAPGSDVIVPGTHTRRDTIDPQLVGALPWGLQYRLAGNSTHTISSSFQANQDIYTSDASLTLEQPLLRNFWIDQNRLSIKLAKKDLKISEYQLLFTIMDIIGQVQLAYYDLIAAQDDVKVRQISLDLARKLLAENRQRVRVGTMAPLDEKQAESEAAQRQAELIDAQFGVLAAENILKNLITDKFQDWYPVAVAPTEKLLAVAQIFDVQDSWLKGISLRPDYAELKTRLERQGLVVSYDFNQLFPTLNILGSYGRSGLDQNLFSTNGIKIHDASFSGTLADLREDVAPRFSYGVVLRTPLTFRSERARYKADKAVLAQRKLELEQRYQQILSDIDIAIKRAQSSYESVQSSRAAREYRQQALDAEQKKYENGKSTPFIVLRLQRDLVDAQALEIRALAVYNRSLSQLAVAEGTILDKTHVTVTFK